MISFFVLAARAIVAKKLKKIALVICVLQVP
jgi:hypothetical protein